MKRAIISVSSKQSIDDDGIELVTPGEFFKKDDFYYAIYNETEISGMDGTRTTLKIKNDKVVIIRDGTTSANMEFEKGKQNISLYNTPYGILELKIKTRDLDVKMDEAGGNVKVNYDMEMQGQESIHTSIGINIKINN